MFRATQYFQCGGYRSEFYLAQDWDLWYRLASLGTFCTIQEALCVCRITLGAVSSFWKPEQNKFAELSRKAMLMREKGISDEPMLAEARQVRSSLKRRMTRQDRAAANYFIGKCLLDSRNQAAAGYLISAIKEDPLHLRAWFSFARSALLIGRNQIL